ncbi:MAG TPA: hypothetical protein VGO40_21900 [Longimicrobium sp.]|jgi:hypothetical protein|nr:hypothetical protein [Longimicrobium sp.]
MRRRLNLLALAVISGGGGLLAAPAPLQATYYDPKRIFVESCCDATGPYGLIFHCCSETGCIVTARGCSKL